MSGLVSSPTALWGGKPGLFGTTGLSTSFGLLAEAVQTQLSLYLSFLTPTYQINGVTYSSLETAGVTFSRGTNATLIDSTGTLTYAPSNQVLNSESFTATSWTGVGTSGLSSVGSNATVAPDGTTTADSLVEDALTSDHRINQSGISGSANAGKYAFSVYLKAGTRTFARIQFDGTINAVSSSGGVNVNLLDGSFGTPTYAGNITSATATVTDVGNGWYRVGLLVALSTVYSFTGASVRIFTMQSLAGSTSFLGNGSNIFVWGAQFGAMTYETAPRAYNSTTPKNLLGCTEEFDNAAWGKNNSFVQTNLLLYSEQFDVLASWNLSNINTPTANAGISPNGTTTADKIVGNGTASSHIITQTGVASATLGTPYTVSVYIKASGYNFAFVGLNGTAYPSPPYISVNLTDGSFFTTNGSPSSTSVTDVGNGWYRVSISGATTVSASTVQIDVRPSPDGVWANRNNAQNGTDGILAWGAQLETGAFSTSYIPTVAASVTRSADIATMVGNNFTNWYNETNGTISVSTDTVTPNESSSAILSFQDAAGAATNRHQISFYTTCSATVFSGTVQANLGTNTLQTLKAAYGYQDNNFGFSANGTTTVVDPSGTVPLSIGYATLGKWDYGAAPSLNGHLKSISYYNGRLTDAQIQALTA